MNELSRLLNSLRMTIDALSKFENDLEAFSERVALQSTLTTFSDHPDEDLLDPTPSVEQLTAILRAASQQLGIEKVRQIVQEEANGRKVAEMGETERRLVRVSLELNGFTKTMEFLK